jgi:hypothetical protein
MHRFVLSSLSLALIGALSAGSIGCSSEEEGRTPAPAAKPAPSPEPAPAPAAAPASTAPPDMPLGLVLGLAQFAPRQPGAKGAPEALPATMEFLVRKDGRWQVTSIADDQSNVVHKAMLYKTVDGRDVILSAAGSAATLKLWSKDKGTHSAETIWEKDFGGRFSRMRDVEVADIYGDDKDTMVVATHDQGIVATVRPADDGSFAVEELDREENTFVHEIEVGDLDGDGVLEAYATPSEPNRLDGKPQSGQVVRYVPAKGEGRVVVADLGDRHAKEIYVGDVDGNGTDELYVIVEGVIEKGSKRLVEPVQIWRYEAGTDPKEGVVIATVEDRLGRFLTVGDLDGDGKKEMVAALFSSGLWLLRPGVDPMAEWSKESIDRRSGGFEHASIITDLDGDGRDELYVASDNDSEVRRYVWDGSKLAREVIYRRTNGNSVFTWNIMPIPVELAP